MAKNKLFIIGESKLIIYTIKEVMNSNKICSI